MTSLSFSVNAIAFSRFFISLFAAFNCCFKELTSFANLSDSMDNFENDL